MFQNLSDLVLKNKINKILCEIELSRDIVFMCIGNSKIYFDAFGADIYNKIKWKQNLLNINLTNNNNVLNGFSDRFTNENKIIDKFAEYEVINENKTTDLKLYKRKNFKRNFYFVKVDEGNNYEKILHAQNLIRKTFNKPYIIVIDTCVCNYVALGTIIVKNKGIIPKSGVDSSIFKKYAKFVVGDASITCCLINKEKQINDEGGSKKSHLLQIRRVGIFGKIIKSSLKKENLKVANAWVENISAKRVCNLLTSF